MIHLKGIEKAFGNQIVLEGLDWHIKRGQRLGLIGPNGAGKTTLLRIIIGEMPPDGGSVQIAKETSLGYLPQESAALRGVTVREEARKGLIQVLELRAALEQMEGRLEKADPEEAEALMERYAALQGRYELLGGFQADSRVEEVLSGLGFMVEEFDRDCSTLSGGWQTRVVLARLLLQSPDVLLLDEPTNHLDLESVVWLESFLAAFKGSLVFISHDRAFLNRLSSHIAELADSQIRTYTGNFDAYLAAAELQREQLQRQARNQQRRVSELERFIDRFRYKATKARQVQSRVKMLEKIDRVNLEREERGIRFNLPEAPKSGRVVMKLSDVQQGYGELILYRGLNLELLRGRRIALVGPNGAGKSSLLKVMAGVLPIQRGDRELGFQVRRYYFAQHQIEALGPERSVLEEVSLSGAGLSPARIRSTLGAFLFSGDTVSKRIAVLSGGEKNRIALVKMLLSTSNLLLLDEPSNHLDMGSRSVLEAALSSFSGTVVLISHDRHFIDAVCDEIWEIRDGRVTPFPGSYREYESRCARGDRPAPFPLQGERQGRPIQAPSSEPSPQKLGRREHKRLEAEARQRRSRRARPIRKKLELLETQIQEMEETQENHRAEQADPAHYQQPSRVKEVGQALRRLEERLEQAYERWEALGAELEALQEPTPTDFCSTPNSHVRS